MLRSATQRARAHKGLCFDFTDHSTATCSTRQASQVTCELYGALLRMGLQLILYLFAAATLFSFAAVQAQLVLPPDCTCPDECICNITSGSINCASRGLTEIPAEINSCAWPGIKKM